MADHGELEYATATGNDLPAHEQTYRNFVTLVDRTEHLLSERVQGRKRIVASTVK